jgi:hypothetical protein
MSPLPCNISSLALNVLISTAIGCSLVGCARNDEGDIYLYPHGDRLTKRQHMDRSASDSFYTSIQIFYGLYKDKSIIIFGEGEKYERFSVSGFNVFVIPSYLTHDVRYCGKLKYHGNTAGHFNGLAISLACKLIYDGDKGGVAFLDKLKVHIPNEVISNPEIKNIYLKELSIGDVRIEMDAKQWEWTESLCKQDCGPKQ